MQDQSPPCYIQAEQGIPPARMCSKMSVQTLVITMPGPTASGPIDFLSLKTVLHIQWSQIGPMQVPQLISPESELSLAQVSCFCGYHCHGLDPFAHIITLSLSSIGLRQLSPGLCCRSLYLLPSVAGWIIKVVISLITGEDQLRCPLHCCLESLLESSLQIPGNFPVPHFLLVL